MRVPEVFYCRDIIIVIRQKRNYDIVLLLHYDILRLCILFLTGRSVLILHNRSSFVILIGLASFEPRDYRGVFVIQQKGAPRGAPFLSNKSTVRRPDIRCSLWAY